VLVLIGVVMLMLLGVRVLSVILVVFTSYVVMGLIMMRMARLIVWMMSAAVL